MELPAAVARKISSRLRAEAQGNQACPYGLRSVSGRCRLCLPQAKPALPTKGMMMATATASIQLMGLWLACARRTWMTKTRATPLAQMSTETCHGCCLVQAFTP
jgi:hypothetical protein